jgi:hypothetical protein
MCGEGVHGVWWGVGDESAVGDEGSDESGTVGEFHGAVAGGDVEEGGAVGDVGEGEVRIVSTWMPAV